MIGNAVIALMVFALVWMWGYGTGHSHEKELRFRDRRSGVKDRRIQP